MGNGINGDNWSAVQLQLAALCFSSETNIPNQFEHFRQSVSLDLVALHLLEVVGDAVGHDHLVNVGLLNQPGV